MENIALTDSPPLVVKCPDKVSECPDNNTCCTTMKGGYGCCPILNAVCCKDQKHCCPHGYQCSSGQGKWIILSTIKEDGGAPSLKREAGGNRVGVEGVGGGGGESAVHMCMCML